MNFPKFSKNHQKIFQLEDALEREKRQKQEMEKSKRKVEGELKVKFWNFKKFWKIQLFLRSIKKIWMNQTARSMNWKTILRSKIE